MLNSNSQPGWSVSKLWWWILPNLPLHPLTDVLDAPLTELVAMVRLFSRCAWWLIMIQYALPLLLPGPLTGPSSPDVLSIFHVGSFLHLPAPDALRRFIRIRPHSPPHPSDSQTGLIRSVVYCPANTGRIALTFFSKVTCKTFDILIFETFHVKLTLN